MTASSVPILIIHQGALGDLILSLPALYTLRCHDLKSPWTMAGNPEVLSLLLHRSYAQEVLSIQQRNWSALYQGDTPIPEPFRKFLASFQKAYVFSAGNSSPLIRGLERAGLPNIIHLPSFPDELEKIPVYLRQRAILESADVPWLERETYLFPSMEDRGAAEELLKSQKEIPGQISLWAIHPGSGSPYKNWPWDRFLETARRIKNRGGIFPLFLLGPVEEDKASIPIAEFQKAGFPVLQGLSLPLLAGLLTLCRGYLGNDSGISHLAAAVGIPTLAIFGPTDPLLWGPRGKGVKLFTPTLSCAPCSREKMSSCPRQECLESITVERILEAIETVI